MIAGMALRAFIGDDDCDCNRDCDCSEDNDKWLLEEDEILYKSD